MGKGHYFKNTIFLDGINAPIILASSIYHPYMLWNSNQQASKFSRQKHVCQFDLSIINRNVKLITRKQFYNYWLYFHSLIIHLANKYRDTNENYNPIGTLI